MREKQVHNAFTPRPFLFGLLGALTIFVLLPARAVQSRVETGERGDEALVAAMQDGKYPLGGLVRMTGECSGTLTFQSLSGPALIRFDGNTFTLEAGGRQYPGTLSVRARSKHYISTSVNLTFNDPAGLDPNGNQILSLSLRGCQGMSERGCDSPAGGPGRPIVRGFVLKSVEGDPQTFTFSSGACVELRRLP